MRYLILDNSGNAVDAFRTRVAAEATLRAIVEAEPDAADALCVLAYNDQGRPAGEATTYDDLPPAFRVRSAWTYSTTSGLLRAARKAIRSSTPEYVQGVPFTEDRPVIRSGEPVIH